MRKNENGRLGITMTLIRSMGDYKSMMLLTGLSVFLKHGSTIGVAAIVSYMTGAALSGKTEIADSALMAVLLVCIVLRALSYYGEMLFGHDVAYRVQRDFRVRLYFKIEKLAPAFLMKKHTGHIGASLMGDMELLEWFLAHTICNAIATVAVTLVIILALLSISPVLAILMVMFSILTASTPFILSRLADKQGKESREAFSEANAVTIEGIQGLRDILTLNSLERYKVKNRDAMNRLYQSQIDFSKRQGLESFLMQILVGVFTVIVMGFCAWSVFQGQLAVELYPVCVMLSMLIFNPIIEVCGASRNLGYVFAAFTRIQSVFDERPEVLDEGADIDLSRARGAISFDGVSFRYGKDLPDALKNVSFTVEPGETVAIAGHSGAGKSTCVNMLLRCWDVQAGAVSIDGHDIRDISLKSLHDMVSAVLQDVYLFNTSVRENIRLSKPKATDAEVESAARAACAHEFIEYLPERYDTVIGERGFQLSGGQRQRLSIARAILKKTPIVILDEAVSSLDTMNELAIQNALSHELKGHTRLVVAHRLSTILAADKLVVLKDGCVVQAGVPRELLEQDGYFRDLMWSQISSSPHMEDKIEDRKQR